MARPGAGALIGLALIVWLLPSPVPAEQRRCISSCKQDTTACMRANCGGLRGKMKRTCKRSCRARHGCGGPRIRTLAYVVSACQVDAGGLWRARQELRVRRGNCDPVTVSTCFGGENVGAPCVRPADCAGGTCGGWTEPTLDVGLCGIFGRTRSGESAAPVGVFLRLGVSPDGSRVIFELTHEFSLFPTLTGQTVQTGIFVVEPDGTGLRRLGPASRQAPFVLFADATDPSGFRLHADVPFRFSPNGRLVVFTDLGPGPDGEEAPQIVTLDVVTGERAQVTRLPRPLPSGFLGTWGATFVNDDTIAFGTNLPGTLTLFTVGTDGGSLTEVPTPTIEDDSRLVPEFAVAGRRAPTLLWMRVPGRSENDVPVTGNGIWEVFVQNGDNLLQLTSFGRGDTRPDFLSPNLRRVFFAASANPRGLGTNPSHTCQLFSIDTLGARLRQLTHFAAGDALNGCLGAGPPPGCYIVNVFQDPVTRAVVFLSSCDPFGTNPFGGQIFALRPDGSGLRQLTDTRGMVTEADGSIEVELPGPVGYSTPEQR